MTNSSSPAISMAEKVVVVTGSSGGIGRAIVTAFEGAGARVVGMDIKALGPDDGTYVGDLADQELVNENIDSIERDVGPIDILVNGAGISSAGALLECGADEINRAFRSNVIGPYNVARACGQRMVKRKAGCIINIASVSARLPRFNQGPYCISKAGLRMMTQILAMELAGSGVRCFSVSPGTTATPLLAKQLSSYSEADMLRGVPEHFRTGTPSGRLVQPSEIGDAVLMLASDRVASYVVGDFVIDGGQSLGM
ncbi:SDR family oxidoreductase [Paraburkholderia guartelaensis]|uniref:SDR family oxidoreductase n=1 Tax=Paraburkholderia guartelaensis TaxID=2546446 RepID=A0ABU9S611_9BURK